MTTHRLSAAALAAALGLSACTDPGLTGVGGVRTATAAQVAGCTFVTNLRTTPPVFGQLLGQQGLEYARNQTLAAARSDGANTVVFDEVEPGAPVYRITASAWRC